MNLEPFNSRDLDVSPRSNNSFVSSFLNELRETLNNHRNRVVDFTINKFIDDEVFLENLNNGRTRTVLSHLIPPNALEGDILRFENNAFSIDYDATEKANINPIRDRVVYFYLDRIVDGNWGVLENRANRRVIDIHVDNLPENIREGLILRHENNTFTIDYEATEKARAEIREIWERIRNR
jgi:hypothetical protein